MTANPDSKVLIISDTHLGRRGIRACNCEKLRPLWQGVAHLVINGDVAEIQDPALRGTAARQLQMLQRFCEADGVALTLLSGNHDAHVSNRRYLLLARGQVLVTHGDAMHPALCPWTHGARRMKSAMDRALTQLKPTERDTIHGPLSASQHVALTEADRDRIRFKALRLAANPWRLGRIVHYWATAPALAARFAQHYAPLAHVVIFGHSHRQVVTHRTGRLIINTGSFTFPGRPRAVILNGGELTVWPIGRSSRGYVLEAMPTTRCSLAGPVTRPPSESRIDR